MTLTELLIASTIAMVVVFGITTTDVMRVRVQEDLRRRVGAVVGPSQTQAAIVPIALSHQLEAADRVVLVNPTGTPPSASTLQIRIPQATNFDRDTNYRWDQYLYDSTRKELRYYANTDTNTGGGCGNVPPVVGQLSSVSFYYVDAESLAPAGGDPDRSVFPSSPADTNILGYAITWSDGSRSQTFSGLMALRAAPYSDVKAGTGSSGPGDSGLGLAAPGVNDAPPAPCT